MQKRTPFAHQQGGHKLTEECTRTSSWESREESSTPPIQLLHDEEGQEYTTNISMAEYATQYHRKLFTS
jgi:hypothetical protein